MPGSHHIPAETPAPHIIDEQLRRATEEMERLHRMIVEEERRRLPAPAPDSVVK